MKQETDVLDVKPSSKRSTHRDTKVRRLLRFASGARSHVSACALNNSQSLAESAAFTESVFWSKQDDTAEADAPQPDARDAGDQSANFVCSVAQLKDLVTKLSESVCLSCIAAGLSTEDARRHIYQMSSSRHVLELELRCARGHPGINWASSASFNGNRGYCLNKQLIAAALLCGLERRELQEFMRLAGFGDMGDSAWKRALDDLYPIIQEEVDRVIAENIAAVNAEPCGSIISTDVQFCRPQRSGGGSIAHAAPFATCTVMSKTPGASHGCVVGIKHVRNQDLLDHGFAETQSKEKLATTLACEVVSEELNGVALCVSDPSSTTHAIFASTFLRNAKHSAAEIGCDPWHTDKNIAKSHRRLIEERRKLTPEERIGSGNRQYTARYPEVQELGIKTSDVTGWAAHCRAGFHSDAAQCRDEWMKHWDWVLKRSRERRVVLSAAFCKAYCKWLEDVSDDIVDSRFNVFTSEEESSHRVSLVYWRKGYRYGWRAWCARQNLKVLDWNENHGSRESKYDHSTEFRCALLAKFVAHMNR